VNEDTAALIRRANVRRCQRYSGDRMSCLTYNTALGEIVRGTRRGAGATHRPSSFSNRTHWLGRHRSTACSAARFWPAPSTRWATQRLQDAMCPRRAESAMRLLRLANALRLKLAHTSSELN
jgi:hypothetical protein